MREVERLLEIAPIARPAWESFGEVIMAEDYAEMTRIADAIASEHVQVTTADPDYFRSNMTNYSALSLGPRTDVSHGDKVIGTNRLHPMQEASEDDFDAVLGALTSKALSSSRGAVRRP